MIAINSESLYKNLIAFTASVYQVHDTVISDVKLDGITQVQYRILELLAVSEAHTLSQIAACLQLSMPNASRELRKLTEQGLCQKNIDTEDKRKQYISLSPQGKTMMNEVFNEIENIFAKRIKDHSDEHMKQLMDALRLLQENVFYTNKDT